VQRNAPWRNDGNGSNLAAQSQSGSGRNAETALWGALMRWMGVPPKPDVGERRQSAISGHSRKHHGNLRD